MAHKQVFFRSEAREKILRGVTRWPMRSGSPSVPSPSAC